MPYQNRAGHDKLARLCSGQAWRCRYAARRWTLLADRSVRPTQNSLPKRNLNGAPRELVCETCWTSSLPARENSRFLTQKTGFGMTRDGRRLCAVFIWHGLSHALSKIVLGQTNSIDHNSGWAWTVPYAARRWMLWADRSVRPTNNPVELRSTGQPRAAVPTWVVKTLAVQRRDSIRFRSG